jgi:probable addiction module antidote protein
MDSEERIRGFLEAAMEDGGMEALPLALAVAIKARAINQLAKETGIDRLELCRMLTQDPAAYPPDPDAVAKVAQAFEVPVPVGAGV